ncbi:hypothetical protein [Roseivirga sp.]|uniref:hypothetical protein n=1 Tax=Roseivirga sp. TaxID=1964215 RepID=UPI003B8E20F2
MKNLIPRFFGVIIVVAALLFFGKTTNGQVTTCGNEGFRDYYEDCTISLRANLLNINVLLEASGSKNNCLKSEDNVCESFACISSAAAYIIENIEKPH